MSKKKIAGTRKSTMDEARLLRRLAEVSDLSLSMEWLEGLVVKPMDDGGMGSFLFSQQASATRKDYLARKLVACNLRIKTALRFPYRLT